MLHFTRAFAGTPTTVKPGSTFLVTTAPPGRNVTNADNRMRTIRLEHGGNRTTHGNPEYVLPQAFGASSKIAQTLRPIACNVATTTVA